MPLILKRFSPRIIHMEDVDGFWMDCPALLKCDKECVEEIPENKVLMLHTSILSPDLEFLKDMEHLFQLITVHATSGEEFLKNLPMDREKLVSITLPAILNQKDMKSAGITLPPDSITIKQVAISVKAGIRKAIIRPEYADKVKRTFGRDFKTFVFQEGTYSSTPVDFILIK